MPSSASLIAITTVVGLIACCQAKAPWGMKTRPYVIGHRGGACHTAPEHTAASYLSGIAHGVDFSECDVCWSKDMVPICRHEPFLSQTTNALDVFPDKVVTKVLDGSTITDVWAEDLTLSQLKSLRCHQKTVAPTTNRTHLFDGMFQILTLDEHIQLMLSQDRVVGIYPELKHSTYFNKMDMFKNAGTTTMDQLIKVLHSYGYTGPINSVAWNKKPAFIQSFEQNDLVYASMRTCIPLVQLTDSPGYVSADRSTKYEDIVAESSLDDIASYASGFGPWKNTLAAPPADNANGALVASGLLDSLQNRGFQVHPYTFRPEMNQMAPVFAGVYYDEYNYYLRNLTLDGMFLDSASHLTDYLTMEKIIGNAWPLNLVTRLNRMPLTCKRANAAQLALARQQYPSA